ncbi:MAG: hypothetical protein C7B45_05795 [Sulfobacillus acidophilus]|uniref:Glycoside hydrolase family 42 N-terminal domain-containing protein n=1 Tax=Sulfobacillus acidophilus TaxID=53633 RepID=A0A2T2WKD7_9FIRM|nr:MAG: hypothetical protein C7B45_05795 [Sulfobacillus acidophilus]
MFSFGANYWSRHGGPRMWTDFDSAAVKEELAWARRIGIDTLRWFLYWPDMEPQPGVDATEPWEHVAQFLEMAAREHLTTYPTLLVGHMSGQNWDPPWRDGRDLWTDPVMVQHTEAYIRRSVSRLRDMPTIGGWILTNEWPLYAGPTSPGVFRVWLSRMVQAVFESDGKHRPLSLGDGAWNAMGVNNGFTLSDLHTLTDIVGPHVYPEGEELLEVAMASYVHCQLAHGKRPVLLEEFGCSDAFGSETEQAVFYRSQIAGAIMAGAIGAWAWCLCDFDLRTTIPYAHHPFELRFGLFSTNGKEKATASVVKELQEACGTLGPVTHDPIGVVVPALQSGMIPFTRGPEGTLMTRVAGRMLRTLAQLGYNPIVIHEPPHVGPALSVNIGDFPELEYVDTIFVVAPRLGEPLRERLWQWVREGGNLYLAYSWNFWFPDLPEILGVERSGFYNVKEHVVEKMTLKWQKSNALIKLTASGLLPTVTLSARGASECATDDQGQHRIFRYAWGKGTITVNSIGIEAAEGPITGLELLYHQYLSEVGPRLRVELQGVGAQAAIFESGHVLAMNHGTESVTLLPAKDTCVTDLHGQVRERVLLPPHDCWIGYWKE